jgi:hypothetical protein
MNKPKIKKFPSIKWDELSLTKKILLPGLALGILLFLFVIILLFFPQTYINRFLKAHVKDSFAKAYPQYSLMIANVNYNFLKNRIECDSVSLVKTDSTFSCTLNAISLSGISWIKLFREKDSSSNAIANSVLAAEGIVLNFKQSQYQIRCGRLRLSVPDSEIVADSLEINPLINDEQFFAESKFRTTRYRLAISKISANGLVFSRLLYGSNYAVRSIYIREAFIGILVNMDKPWNTKAPSPLMPGAGLSLIKDTVCVDSLKVMNSSLNYYERYVVGEKAASVSFDKIQALAVGITNHTGRRDTIVIHAQGNFMNTSTMKLIMSIPLGSPQFSFSYNGSLRKMEVSSLNKFLEIAEHHRIKSGTLQSATYNINVNSGHATGFVRAEYNDLSVAILNNNTGSENGIFDKISSLIAKTFIIKENNMPDNSGSVKIGIVKYTRKPDETFIQFVWIALRGGVCNIIGI